MSDIEEDREPPKVLTLDILKPGLSQIGRIYGIF